MDALNFGEIFRKKPKAPDARDALIAELKEQRDQWRELALEAIEGHRAVITRSPALLPVDDAPTEKASTDAADRAAARTMREKADAERRASNG